MGKQRWTNWSTWVIAVIRYNYGFLVGLVVFFGSFQSTYDFLSFGSVHARVKVPNGPESASGGLAHVGSSPSSK